MDLAQGSVEQAVLRDQLPTIKKGKSFWDTIKTVSVKQVAEEARKPFALAVVGAPEKRAEVIKHLFPGVDSEEVLPERSLVRVFDSTAEEDGFPRESGSFDIVIDAGGGRVDAPPGTPVFSVEEIGSWERVEERILDQRPDLALSLARRFPGFRNLVGQRIVADISSANAKFAMLSALPGTVPILGPFLPPAAVGDILMLTKNQALMMFRLAAAYDLPLDVRARARELAPLLANAFGWRALAREVVGVVPGGVGLVLRGTIAYAGTAAIGKAMHRYYQTGQLPTRAQIGRFYKETYANAKLFATELARSLTAKRPQIPR